MVDSSHATAGAVRFFNSFFTAKSRHNVDATMGHFSKAKLTYIDATLGWPFYSYQGLQDLFAQYMPKWPPAGFSYPTRILGNERSAVVAFTARRGGSARLPQGAGATLLHVVGGDMFGGYEWGAGAAHRATVRRGTTAIALDGDGRVSRVTTVWDGAMMQDAEVRALVALSIE